MPLKICAAPSANVGVRSMKVVGLTITGAAISRDILQKLAPRTVLIEEAAEVLEPLLITALGNWEDSFSLEITSSSRRRWRCTDWLKNLTLTLR
jgi:hypothetical protein